MGGASNELLIVAILKYAEEAKPEKQKSLYPLPLLIPSHDFQRQLCSWQALSCFGKECFDRRKVNLAIYSQAGKVDS